MTTGVHVDLQVEDAAELERLRNVDRAAGDLVEAYQGNRDRVSFGWHVERIKKAREGR